MSWCPYSGNTNKSAPNCYLFTLIKKWTWDTTFTGALLATTMCSTGDFWWLQNYFEIWNFSQVFRSCLVRGRRLLGPNAQMNAGLSLFQSVCTPDGRDRSQSCALLWHRHSSRGHKSEVGILSNCAYRSSLSRNSRPSSDDGPWKDDGIKLANHPMCWIVCKGSSFLGSLGSVPRTLLLAAWWISRVFISTIRAMQ